MNASKLPPPKNNNINKPAIIVGGGGHGRVLADTLRIEGYSLAGVIDPAFKQGSTWHFGLEVLGDDSVLEGYSSADFCLVNGLGYLPGYHRRRALFEELANGLSRSASGLNQNFHFCSVIHPAAIIAGDVDLGEGVQILAGAIVNPGTTIGKNTIVNSNAVVEHECQIEEHCHIAPGAVICGGVVVGEGCFIGAGAVVIQEQQLEPYTVVPAGKCIR